jgi:hypothetical protein
MPSASIPAPTLQASSDPCSFDYLRTLNMPSTSSAGSSSSNKAPKKGFFSKLFHKKKSTSTKTNKSGFVMPHEMNQQNRQPSLRSRPSRAMMSGGLNEPVPEISVTGSTPSANRRGSAHLHNYGGSAAPSPQPATVRFLHPAVNDVRMRPRTPSNHSGMLLDVHNPVSAQNSPPPSRESFFTDSEDAGNDFKPIRPKTIWRDSGHFRTVDGELTSFSEFKARLDGHPFSPVEGPEEEPVSRVPEHPPTLDFILPVGTLNIDDEPVLRTPERPPTLDFIPTVGTFSIDDEPVFQTDTRAEVERNRNRAFDMLQGGGVLAVVPAEDVPESAVPVLSRQYPPALTPAQYPQALVPGVEQRPFSFPAALTEKQIYKAYQPQANIAASFSKAPESRLEVPHLRQGPRPRTPSFSNEVTQHKAHYARVESGIFEATDIPQPSAPAVPKIARKPLTPPKDKPAGNLLVPKVRPGTPRPVQKQPESKVPVPTKMNSNRYPIIDPNNTKRFSAEAKYQRRSVNDVEAKFQREQATKKGGLFRSKDKKKSKTATLSRASSKASKASRASSRSTLIEPGMLEMLAQEEDLQKRRAFEERQAENGRIKAYVLANPKERMDLLTPKGMREVLDS